jgi:hypothetical protein
LWRRGMNRPGQQAQFVGVWSFGTCALPPRAVNAFCHPAPSSQCCRASS